MMMTMEDKDASVLWSGSTKAHFLRLAAQVLCSGRWHLTSASTEVLVNFYRFAVDRILPQKVMPVNNAFSVKNLPYMFGSVTAKCVATDGPPTSKCCKKPQHSCLRGIVSFIHFPGREST